MNPDEKRTQRIRRCLTSAQETAARVVRRAVRGEDPESNTPWSECSVRMRVAMALVGDTFANERAKKMAETPRMMGIVMMTQKIEDPKKWEQMANKVSATGAIEAEVAVPALPAKDEDPDGS